MKFKDALDIDVGEREQFHVFYKRSFCGRLKKGEKANEINIKKLIIEHNGFYVCEVNSSFDWAVDLELRDLDFKYEKRSFEDGVQSKQDEVDELQKNFNNALKTIGIQQQFLDDTDGTIKIITSQVDELQKRIDEVVHILTYTNHASTTLCNELREILKGESNE